MSYSFAWPYSFPFLVLGSGLGVSADAGCSRWLGIQLFGVELGAASAQTKLASTMMANTGAAIMIGLLVIGCIESSD